MKKHILFVLLAAITSKAFAQISGLYDPGTTVPMELAVALSNIELRENQIGKIKKDDCTFQVSTRKRFFESHIELEFKSAVCADKSLSMEHWNLALELEKPIHVGDSVPIPRVYMLIVLNNIANH